ncbi:MAG: adenosylcobinamide amidohydrolase [Deltaproteobacteria bacterium]|nr:adenosylcobinamide amidohydrolase [Deltaproteobacteria bacterium]
MKIVKNSLVILKMIAAHCLIILWASAAFSYPVTFTDTQGREITIHQRPSRVVSLVPSITEIIMNLGAGDALKGITYHSTDIPGAAHKNIVGGFISPNLDLVEAISPDLIFYADIQKGVVERFSKSSSILIKPEIKSLEDSYKVILQIGRIFDVEDKAEDLVREIKEQLELVAKKVDAIPQSKRKRVIRLMGLDPVMVPGDDSFQNEMIRAAGGIPPVLGKRGQIVTMTQEEWKKFNPQIIYGCGGYTDISASIFNQPGWKDVDAVKNRQIFDFPCDLTCRAATHTGEFAAWLSARIYSDEFSMPGRQVQPDRTTGSRRLDIPLTYVLDSRITTSLINDFTNKSLIIDFEEPLSIVSTLDGYRTGIETVMNHYSSPPGWVVNHHLDVPALRRLIYPILGKQEEKTSCLFTGADMDHLSIKKEQFKEMQVYALVTAGVRSNALRMSKDEGFYYEPGTINIIILPNMRLTQRAMARAIISATEAKTAALWDMDIRSSYTPMIHPATGTGTDNIIIVEGEGPDIDNSGGHTKMGELIAKVVYEGVQEAADKQNGIVPDRDIFQRLMDRKINLFGVITLSDCDCGVSKSQLTKEMDNLLLKPEYASFIAASLTLSDDFEKGLICDLTPIELWCQSMAERIAEIKIEQTKDLIREKGIPIVIRMSLNALANGVYYKERP